MTFISYGDSLSTTGVLALLNTGLQFAEHQAARARSPYASAGRSFYCWDNIPSHMTSCIHGRDSRLIWFWFQEVMGALMTLITRFGGIEMVYSVEDPLLGPIAVGTFEAIKH